MAVSSEPILFAGRFARCYAEVWREVAFEHLSDLLTSHRHGLTISLPECKRGLFYYREIRESTPGSGITLKPIIEADCKENDVIAVNAAIRLKPDLRFQTDEDCSTRQKRLIKRLEAMEREAESTRTQIERLIMSQSVNDGDGEPFGSPRVTFVDPPGIEWPPSEWKILWKDSHDLVDGQFDSAAVDGGLSAFVFSRSQQFWTPAGVTATTFGPIRVWLEYLRNPNQDHADQPLCMLRVPGNPQDADRFHLLAISEKAKMARTMLRTTFEERMSLERRIEQDLRRLNNRGENGENPALANLVRQSLDEHRHSHLWSIRHFQLWATYAEIVRHYAASLMSNELATCRQMSRFGWRFSNESTTDWDELETELDQLANRFQFLKPTSKVTAVDVPDVPSEPSATIVLDPDQKRDTSANSLSTANTEIMIKGPETPKSFHVFLSHNSKDKPAVKRLGTRLKQQGLNPWLDEWELRPGLAWLDSIETIMITMDPKNWTRK